MINDRNSVKSSPSPFAVDGRDVDAWNDEGVEGNGGGRTSLQFGVGRHRQNRSSFAASRASRSRARSNQLRFSRNCHGRKTVFAAGKNIRSYKLRCCLTIALKTC